MNRFTSVRFYGLFFGLVVLVIGSIGLLTSLNHSHTSSPSAGIPVTSSGSSINDSMDVGANAPWLKTEKTTNSLSQIDSMDVGANAPWLRAAPVPVTGRGIDSMDAGANAPWLIEDPSIPSIPSAKSDRSPQYLPVPTSNPIRTGAGR